ncbi:hypothetical protein NMG60_11012358 [Bertholletia excelsa]
MEEQKAPADWLPPDWTVEVRVRKNGKKDKCYTDPSKALKFFSKPEVLRYLGNSETKHSGSQRKRKCNTKSPAETEQLNLEDSRTTQHLVENQSSQFAVSKDEETLEACTGRKGASFSSFNLPRATDSEQREESDPITDAFKSAPTAEALPEMPPENGVENMRSKRTKPGSKELHNKEKLNLPRRASKRLAGIDVDPIPELKPSNRARRVSGRRLEEAETKKDGKTDKNESLNENQECPIVLPPGNISIQEENVAWVETDNKAAEEPGLSLNVAFKDLWMDPCIDFAIKTLTGAIPIGDDSKAEENPGSSLELGDSWDDPCIEFAVKTLTGAIPVVDDLGIQDYLQQQFTSSGGKGR